MEYISTTTFCSRLQCTKRDFLLCTHTHARAPHFAVTEITFFRATNSLAGIVPRRHASTLAYNFFIYIFIRISGKLFRLRETRKKYTDNIIYGKKSRCHWETGAGVSAHQDFNRTHYRFYEFSPINAQR